MPRRCRKNRFESEEDAREAIARLQKIRPGKREQRAYRCPNCQHWHLTSRPHA